MVVRSIYYAVYTPKLLLGCTGSVVSNDSQGAVCYEVNCKDTLLHLKGCSQEVLSSLRHVTLTRRMMFGDDEDIRYYIKELGQLLSKLALDPNPNFTYT